MSTIVIVVLLCTLAAFISAAAIVIWVVWLALQLPDDDPYGNPNDPPGDVPHYPVVTIKGEPHPYLGHPGCEPKREARS